MKYLKNIRSLVAARIVVCRDWFASVASPWESGKIETTHHEGRVTAVWEPARRHKKTGAMEINVFPKGEWRSMPSGKFLANKTDQTAGENPATKGNR